MPSRGTLEECEYALGFPSGKRATVPVDRRLQRAWLNQTFAERRLTPNATASFVAESRDLRRSRRGGSSSFGVLVTAAERLLVLRDREQRRIELDERRVD